MRVTIEKEVFRKFDPLFKLGLVLIKDFDNESKLKEARRLLKEIEAYVHLTFNKDNLKSHYLIAPWAVAQEEFGKKAKHYQTSVERLLQIVLEKKSVAANDVLTTLLNYLALKHIVPFGVDDLEKVEGDLTFDISKSKEKVDVLRKLPKGTLYYKDKSKVLGTKLDFWKNDKTAPNKKTKAALIHFEILPPLDQQKTKELLRETKNLLRTFCKARIKVLMLSKERNSVKL